MPARVKPKDALEEIALELLKASAYVLRKAHAPTVPLRPSDHIIADPASVTLQRYYVFKTTAEAAVIGMRNRTFEMGSPEEGSFERDLLLLTNRAALAELFYRRELLTSFPGYEFENIEMRAGWKVVVSQGDATPIPEQSMVESSKARH